MLGVKGDIGLMVKGQEDTINFNVYHVAGCTPTVAYRFHDLQVTGTPFTINNWKVTAPVFETRNLTILTNPGKNKVLVSDENGNASWSNAAIFNDQDWLESTTSHSDETGPSPGLVQKSLFANPRYGNIGIGTDEPLSKLHIVDGNVLISRSACKAPGNINGSLLFGEVVSRSWPLGEWGIEYERLEEDYYSGGLNFWKVASAYNAGADNCLFLRNNGNIGVGTSTPLDKFQISRGFEKLVFGSMVESFDAGTAYIGFNSARLRSNGNSWLFDTDGSLNGGCITLGDLHGNYHIVTLPSNGRKNEPQRLENEKLPVQIRMTVTGQGDVGIGTTNTHGYKLAVLGRILCTNLKVQLEQDWPDYVFRDNYPLMPLSELEQYITLNNRLPGIPSSEEIKNNGIDVSNMQVLLVRKIEELTRYILEQQKILAQQQQQIEKLIMLQKNR